MYFCSTAHSTVIFISEKSGTDLRCLKKFDLKRPAHLLHCGFVEPNQIFLLVASSPLRELSFLLDHLLRSSGNWSRSSVVLFSFALDLFADWYFTAKNHVGQLYYVTTFLQEIYHTCIMKYRLISNGGLCQLELALRVCMTSRRQGDDGRPGGRLLQQQHVSSNAQRNILFYIDGFSI